jgi:hypothetical protein
VNEDNCARLEKIQGGVDLINERLKHANELQNERHDAILKNIAVWTRPTLRSMAA